VDVTNRQEVRIPVGGAELAAWLYRPARAAEEGIPCVVLAHGFSGVRDMQLERPAERFASAGFAALVFDYRHFGDSGGDPRQVVSIREQYEDWDAAIAFAEQLEGVDRTRIALWGTSFCGGHVIDAAVRHPHVAAVVAQAPFVDGLSQLLRTPPRIGLRLGFDAIRDEMRRLRGRSPLLVPVSAPRGGYAVLSDPHVWASIPVVVPPDSTWRNEVAARIALRLGFHRPGLHAGRMKCPCLVQVLDGETVLSKRAAERAAQRAPRGELRRYDGLNHFDVYVGEGFERLVDDQLSFLQRHLEPRRSLTGALT
jgi:fermentation-respiration switch protein FrsA (DUF1100 family)